MPWIKIKPESSGGGRAPAPAGARMYKGGQLVINANCLRLLGETERIEVEVDPDRPAIRMSPTTPTNEGAYTVIGGGGAIQTRINLTKVARRWPQFVGDYTAHKIAGGVELRKKERP